MKTIKIKENEMYKLADQLVGVVFSDPTFQRYYRNAIWNFLALPSWEGINEILRFHTPIRNRITEGYNSIKYPFRNERGGGRTQETMARAKAWAEPLDMMLERIEEIMEEYKKGML